MLSFADWQNQDTGQEGPLPFSQWQGDSQQGGMLPFNQWQQGQSAPVTNTQPSPVGVTNQQNAQAPSTTSPSYYNVESGTENWTVIPTGQENLAASIFGKDNLRLNEDGTYSSPYGLNVGGMDSNPDFYYDEDASGLSESTYDAIYRSRTNPEYSVTDWQTNKTDFRTDDYWDTAFDTNPLLKEYLGSLEGAPSADAPNDRWTSFAQSSLNDFYNRPASRLEPTPFAGFDDSGNPTFVTAGGTLLGHDDSGSAVYAPTPGEFTGYDDSGSGVYNKSNDQSYDRNITRNEDADSRFLNLVNNFDGIGAYDKLKGIDAEEFYNASHDKGWNDILSGTDPILLNKGNGEYDTWGRFSKYIDPKFSDKYSYWNYYPEADTKEEWLAGSVPDYVKLGKAAQGHIKKYSPGKLNSDQQNAPWLTDSKLGTGFAFSEDKSGDYGFAPSTGAMKMKGAGAHAWVGPLLSVASLIFPVLAPVAAAYNVARGAQTGNWGQAIGGAIGGLGSVGAFGSAANAATGASATSGALGSGGSLGSTLGNALNISPALGNTIVSTGVGGISNGWQGALSGGLSSYAGSISGGNPIVSSLVKTGINSAFEKKPVKKKPVKKKP